MPTRVGTPTIKAGCALWELSAQLEYLSDQSDRLAETTRCISVIVPYGYNSPQLKTERCIAGQRTRLDTRGVHQLSSKM